MPERDQFELHIYGTVFIQAEIDAAVETLGLRSHVTFYDHVSDEVLEAGLDQADLAINLRYPTMGEASASLLRIWDHALPSLVTYTEGYASLPPDAVCFVRPEHEQADIQRHLRQFLLRPGYFREKGQRARQWLLEHHRPAVYVERLSELCDQADEMRSRHNELRLAERVGRAFAPWTNTAAMTAREAFYAARIAEMV